MFLFLQMNFDWGNLGDILSGYFDSLLAFLLQVVTLLWNVLVWAVNFLWSVISWLGNFFYTLLQDVWKGLKWIWENVIKLGLTKLVKLFQTVRAWLKSVLGPVINFLNRVRAWYDKFFRQWIRPVLQMLQNIRKILTIFRLLGFKWAARLDGDIAMIEGKITQIYTTLRGYINQAITYLDLIVDPGGILRRNPLFAALLGYAPELRNAVLGAAYRPLGGGEIDSQTHDRSIATVATQQQNFTDYYSQGQLTPEDEESRKQFAKAFDDLQGGQDNYG